MQSGYRRVEISFAKNYSHNSTSCYDQRLFILHKRIYRYHLISCMYNRKNLTQIWIMQFYLDEIKQMQEQFLRDLDFFIIFFSFYCKYLRFSNILYLIIIYFRYIFFTLIQST